MLFFCTIIIKVCCINRGIIPESQKPTNDLIDFLTDACQRIVNVELEDGRMQQQLILDPKKVWLKTHIVNSPTFGRYTYVREVFGGMAKGCYNFMSFKRAKVLSEQIIQEGDNFDYSIDAKSSEILRDKNNTQSCLIDKMKGSKIEKQYTLKEDVKKSLFSGFVGREEDKDRD